jgi:hypothetical protein
MVILSDAIRDSGSAGKDLNAGVAGGPDRRKISRHFFADAGHVCK